jgi:hypothetical protein
MDIKKLISSNQKKMATTRNSISAIDIRLQNIDMEIKAIQKLAGEQVKLKNYEKLNLLYDKEQLLNELNETKQKIEDLKNQL